MIDVKSYIYNSEEVEFFFLKLLKKYVGDFNFEAFVKMEASANRLFVDIDETVVSEEGWNAYKSYSKKLKDLPEQHAHSLFYILLAEEFNQNGNEYIFHHLIVDYKKVILTFEPKPKNNSFN